MDDYFLIEHFFTDEELDSAWEEVKRLPHKDKYIGEFSNFFPNEKYSTVSKINEDRLPELHHTSIIFDKIRTVFQEEIVFKQMTYQQLHLPFGVHSDWDPIDKENQVESFYIILVPFHDIDSRTVIFDQRSEKTSDLRYIRLKNKKVENPVPLDIWERYLSHCDIRDRELLSLKEITPAWKKGQLIALKRDIFHSSDSFHLNNAGTKRFLQIYSDRKLK